MRNNDLILHCGAGYVEREQLRAVPTPAPTSSWRPVPHADVADLIADHAIALGYQIENEQYGLNPSGTKMFGVLRFHPQGHPEHSRALGFRNSHDKSFALGLTVGVRVLVCDNLAIGGEQTLHRRHTSRIEIEALIPAAFAMLPARFLDLEERIGRLKERPIQPDEARLLAVRAAEEGAIPSSDILAVLREFREPRHAEFAAPTQWNLYNAFTETAKKYSPERADGCYRALGTIFGLAQAA
jgi:hypothetical protein